LQAKKALYHRGCVHVCFEDALGAVAINKTGSPPEQTLNLCINTDAVLFGAIGDPKYDNDQKQSATGARIVEIERIRSLQISDL
jgi:3-isopropylmalate dehydrogenase